MNVPFAIRATTTLADEVDRMFVSQTVFRIESPKAFRGFLNRLSPMQHSYLQRVTIGLLAIGYEHRCVWKDWSRSLDGCDRVLEGLKVVKFDIYGGYWSRTWDWDEPEAPRHIHRLVDVLEILTKALRRLAPEVRFVMDQDNMFVETESCLIGKVLSEVE